MANGNLFDSNAGPQQSPKGRGAVWFLLIFGAIVGMVAVAVAGPVVYRNLGRERVTTDYSQLHVPPQRTDVFIDDAVAEGFESLSVSAVDVTLLGVDRDRGAAVFETVHDSDHFIESWSLATRQREYRQPVRRCANMFDQRVVCSVDSRGPLQLIDTREGSVIREIPGEFTGAPELLGPSDASLIVSASVTGGEDGMHKELLGVSPTGEVEWQQAVPESARCTLVSTADVVFCQWDEDSQSSVGVRVRVLSAGDGAVQAEHSVYEISGLFTDGWTAYVTDELSHGDHVLFDYQNNWIGEQRPMIYGWTVPRNDIMQSNTWGSVMFPAALARETQSGDSVIINAAGDVVFHNKYRWDWNVGYVKPGSSDVAFSVDYPDHIVGVSHSGRLVLMLRPPTKNASRELLLKDTLTGEYLLRESGDFGECCNVYIADGVIVSKPRRGVDSAEVVLYYPRSLAG